MMPELRISADEVADEKIAAMKIFEVFVDDQADEQVAAGSFLIFDRKPVEGFRQDFVGGAVADFVDEVLFHFRERPGFADGRAALRNDAGQFHVAADGNRHAAFLKHVAVQINLRGLAP